VTDNPLTERIVMNPIKYYMYVTWHLMTGRFTSRIEVLQPEVVLHGAYLFLNWEYFMKSKDLEDINLYGIRRPFFMLISQDNGDTECDCGCD
jgi:hypothetical protein